MTNRSEPTASTDGDALNAQLFQMLEDIARELAGNVVFPTSFDAALRLRRELQDANLPTARIASIVGVEPLVAAKLMRLASSALHSPDGTPAKDIRGAISRLGVDLVRTTALAVAMGQLMRSRDMERFSDMAQALWDHSLATAAAARILARTHTRINPDQALLAGLVHDLGAFYMLYRVAQYPQLRASPESVRQIIVQWHESIGATLLHALGMTEEIVEAAVDHDQPRSAPEAVRTLTDIVYVGNILASAISNWFDQGSEENVEETIIRRNFGQLLPEIEADAREMRAVFA